jgi:hypothetical protein
MACRRESVNRPAGSSHPPEAKRIKPRDDQPALRDQDTLGLPKKVMGVAGDLQRMGQHEEIKALAQKW